MKTKKRRFRPQFEQLEERCTPASATWAGGAGLFQQQFDWTFEENWVPSTVPTVNHDVYIQGFNPSLETPYVPLIYGGTNAIARSITSLPQSPGDDLPGVGIAGTLTLIAGVSTWDGNVGGVPGYSSGILTVDEGGTFYHGGTISNIEKLVITTGSTFDCHGDISVTELAVEEGSTFNLLSGTITVDRLIVSGMSNFVQTGGTLNVANHASVNDASMGFLGGTSTLNQLSITNFGTYIVEGETNLTITDTLTMSGVETQFLQNTGGTVTVGTINASNSAEYVWSAGNLVANVNLSETALMKVRYVADQYTGTMSVSTGGVIALGEMVGDMRLAGTINVFGGGVLNFQNTDAKGGIDRPLEYSGVSHVVVHDMGLLVRSGVTMEMLRVESLTQVLAGGTLWVQEDRGIAFGPQDGVGEFGWLVVNGIVRLDNGAALWVAGTDGLILQGSCDLYTNGPTATITGNVYLLNGVITVGQDQTPSTLIVNGTMYMKGGTVNMDVNFDQQNVRDYFVVNGTLIFDIQRTVSLNVNGFGSMAQPGWAWDLFSAIAIDGSEFGTEYVNGSLVPKLGDPTFDFLYEPNRIQLRIVDDDPFAGEFGELDEIVVDEWFVSVEAETTLPYNIDAFKAIVEEGSIFTFIGQIVDEQGQPVTFPPPPEGPPTPVFVVLGGLPSIQGRAVPVGIDGKFAITVRLGTLEEGTLTGSLTIAGMVQSPLALTLVRQP